MIQGEALDANTPNMCSLIGALLHWEPLIG